MKFEVIEKRLKEISTNLDKTSATTQDVARHVMQQERAFKNLVMGLHNDKDMSGFTLEHKQSLQKLLVHINNKLLDIKIDILEQQYKSLLDAEKNKKAMKTAYLSPDAARDIIKKSHLEYISAVQAFKVKYLSFQETINKEYEELKEQINKIMLQVIPKRTMPDEAPAGVGLRGIHSKTTLPSEDVLKTQRIQNALMEEARIKQSLKQTSPFDVSGRNPGRSALAPLSMPKSSKLSKR